MGHANMEYSGVEGKGSMGYRLAALPLRFVNETMLGRRLAHTHPHQTCAELDRGFRKVNLKESNIMSVETCFLKLFFWDCGRDRKGSQTLTTRRVARGGWLARHSTIEEMDRPHWLGRVIMGQRAVCGGVLVVQVEAVVLRSILSRVMDGWGAKGYGRQQIGHTSMSSILLSK